MRAQRVSFLLFLFSAYVLNAAGGHGIVHVTATPREINLHLAAGSQRVVELESYQSPDTALAPDARILLEAPQGSTRIVRIPRFDQGRDRIYSGFVSVANGKPACEVRFVDEWRGVSKYVEPYPHVTSKKGLQVQMVDDALTLGVKHACLNLNLGNAISPTPAPDDLPCTMDGQTFHFARNYIESMDRTIKQLSDAGVIVNLILLNIESQDPARNRILLHPRYDKACPEHFSAFNTATPEGLAWFKASIEFLADRYSACGHPYGRVCGYIVGNEVNSHWVWCNMGRVSIQEFAADYARTMRVCFTAVRKFSPSARVYVSLEHHWNIHYAALKEDQSFAGRPFLDRLNEITKAGGDFDWGLAFHPYPENLFECATWKDKTATYREDTPRITFKNIEMLPRYFHRPEMMVVSSHTVNLSSPKAGVPLNPPGQLRHIILSEQGFHSKGTPESEQLQAAAYCYAWRKVCRLDGIDSFILHRHVDHAAEGGLNLGLWRRNTSGASPCEPQSKKPIYDVFRAADTSNWEEAFRFALPIIGAKDWRSLEK